MHLRQYHEAYRMLARVISIAPRNPHAINAVGNVYIAEKRYAEALAAFDAALAEEGGIASIHYNRALALHNLSRPSEAASSYKRAIELDPSVSAMHSGLGAVLLQLGDFDQARSAFAMALKIEPDNIETLQRWFSMHRAEANDPHVRSLTELAERVDALPINQQIELHYTLAQVYADLGRDAESFDHLIIGNAKKRRITDYNEAQELAFYSAAEETFTGKLLREKGGAGNPTKAPIFIVGMPRSGTTLIEQILASHPEVTPLGELLDIHEIVTATSLGAQQRFPQWVADFPTPALAHLAEQYLERVGPPASARFTDKMPVNVLYAGMIHLMFPNARFIHARRDALDTCISCFSCLFSAGQPQTYDLEELGHYYRAYDQLSTHWRNVLPPHAYIEVQYETLVADLEGQARRILEHVQLDWDPRVLEFYNNRRIVNTASVQQVRKPIYTSSIGRARRYGDRLAPLLRALGLSE